MFLTYLLPSKIFSMLPQYAQLSQYCCSKIQVAFCDDFQGPLSWMQWILYYTSSLLPLNKDQKERNFEYREKPLSMIFERLPTFCNWWEIVFLLIVSEKFNDVLNSCPLNVRTCSMDDLLILKDLYQFIDDNNKLKWTYLFFIRPNHS